MGKFWNELLMVLVVANILASAETRRKEGKAQRHKVDSQQESHPQRNGSSLRIPLDPILAGDDTTEAGELVSAAREMDFDRTIGDMVSQVRNNPALTKNKCVVDRQLWMSNSRSLSPWSYRINHDENRKPVDIPEAKCSCAGCINPFTMQEDRSMTSVLIYTKIPVRRLLCNRPSKTRKKKKCVRRYRTVVESIAVGCTCIVG
ncbi:interleukin-17B-like [Electrophorus electricus]|uniref:interleukin-17B-like n=1 Tax=Electrophorus electricus TaxID=8005 RepID=UPI0015CF9D3B|nr:interleukin-17B-like [Electrophorus electricus]